MTRHGPGGTSDSNISDHAPATEIPVLRVSPAERGREGGREGGRERERLGESNGESLGERERERETWRETRAAGSESDGDSAEKL